MVLGFWVWGQGLAIVQLNSTKYSFEKNSKENKEGVEKNVHSKMEILNKTGAINYSIEQTCVCKSLIRQNRLDYGKNQFSIRRLL